MTLREYLQTLDPELAAKLDQLAAKENETNPCQCPLGGDETDDCEGCAYSGDYHFVDGECVARPDA